MRSEPSGFVPVVAMPALSFQSRADGVAQSAIVCAVKSGDLPRCTSVKAPSGVRILLSAADAVGVGHSAMTCPLNFGSPRLLTLPFNRFTASSATGVCHKPQSISSMGRIDGTSRNNGRPNGVADAFQVRMHSVEPMLSNRCRNLLSHDDSGPAGTNKPMEFWPEVAFVVAPASLAGNAERLAGATSGPEGTVIWPSSQSSSVGPSSDAREEVALSVALEVVGSDIDYAPFIDIARRDVAGRDQVAEPQRRIGVDLVVVGGHCPTPSPSPCR